MAAFAITTASGSVLLDAGGTAQVPFTVTNTSGQRLHARARVVPEAPAQAGWFTLASGEQESPPGATLQFVVQVAAPRTAPSGTSRFRLDVIGVENPDELFGQGPWISLEVRAVAQPRRVIWPWILVAVAVVVVIAGGTTLAWVLTHRAALQLQAAKQDFGTVTVGQTGTLPVTVRNSGGTQLTVTAVIQGDTGEFSVTQDTCAGFSLPAGGVCSLSVRFLPTSPGTKTATLRVAGTGSGAQQSLPLRGTAKGVGQLTFSPPVVNVGSFGGAPTTVLVTLTDSGSADVMIRSLQIVQLIGGNFQVVSSTCAGTTLRAGGSCRITIVFQPVGIIFFGPPAVGQLVVQSDLPAPAVLQLNGNLRGITG